MPSSEAVIKSDLRIVDAAGQDLRQIFDDDRIAAPDGFPEHFRPLAEYCSKADIILFLANLKDFMPGGDEEIKTDNEAALNSAMDYLRREGKRCCVLFTQADQYRDYVAQSGGWEEVLRTHISYIYGGHLATHDVPFFPVAAVNDTVIVDKRRVPRTAFTSEGLDDVFAWVVHATCGVIKNIRIKQIVERLQAKIKNEELATIENQEVDNNRRKEQAKSNSYTAGVISFIIIFIVMILWLGLTEKTLIDRPWYKPDIIAETTNWNGIFLALFVAGILSLIIAAIAHSNSTTRETPKEVRFTIDKNINRGAMISGTAQFPAGKINWSVNESGIIVFEVGAGYRPSVENRNALKSWLNQFGDLVGS